MYLIYLWVYFGSPMLTEHNVRNAVAVKQKLPTMMFDVRITFLVVPGRRDPRVGQPVDGRIQMR